jgi:DNA replication protein DnaC
MKASAPSGSPAGALLDRLAHHVHILQMNGDSYRLSRSRRASSDTPADSPTQA